MREIELYYYSYYNEFLLIILEQCSLLGMLIYGKNKEIDKINKFDETRKKLKYQIS